MKFTKLLALGLLPALSLISCQDQPKDTTPWEPLFDGKQIAEWGKVGGEADYKVEDGAIVGITKHNTPNTFLTSSKKYGDFILELEYLVDSTMNSGIQIRSNSLPHYRDGRFHGYQVEIDPSKRSWSAGIYDEARRGWLNNLENNEAARNAFKQNEWNHYRIEAIGDTLKTWINGVPASYLIDDRTAEGYIGLQVHSIGKNKKAGTEIKWRNVNILTKDLDKYSKKSPLTPIVTLNNLTPGEKGSGWKMLWDGESTQGWRGAKLDHFPKQGWKIENGELSVLASGGAESEAGGDIVTDKRYSDFELKLEFKITEGANSGIKYYVNTDLNQGKGSSIGLEFQILDDAKHPDAKQGNHEGSRTVASLYDLIQADTSKHMNPIGEWNEAHIKSKDNHVEHWLNGKKVLEYERRSDEYRKLVSESKYVKWPKFGEADEGNILLQDHGDLVSFRNIKIKELK
ncbi:3-keto-disaccharide hydrolase [Sediminicola luteus]|uniref:3-keto-alpha-glucoside-1,2-lyase/3-keto-2-hydroxy-glucal hydratase domain-containing protein n=1 Tax=Sediminicola luteus TaxID=319238 RepID=A0A2A4G806_9FLAO|nr:DUF1080 domain-containing protein [Sediminicola luteus]PCE64757.1 hypothetical protein B7P33_06185 [Sediminicola luteus]